MQEIFITRHNHLIDPLLSVWEWQIPIYLFLGGLVAGMMIISGYFILIGKKPNTKCTCFRMPLLGLVAISLGMLALFLDLEHKLYVWRLYTTFEWMSPMSWGAWILLLVYPILAVTALVRIPEEYKAKYPLVDNISSQLNDKPFLVKFIGAMSMITGGILGMYTGVLLSTLQARPAWNSAMLWILFLVSGLSSAAALVHMISKEREESRMLAKADNGFLILELMILILIIIGFFTSTESHQQAAWLILGGEYTVMFWVFVVLIGIVIPLIIQLNAVNDKIQHTPIAPLLVIFGGLMLRFLMVSIGQHSHWVNSAFIMP